MEKEIEKVVVGSYMGKKMQEPEAAAIIWDCGSPLYDSYELASLGHVIERHVMTLPFPPCGSKRFVFQPNFPSEEKGLNMVKKEGFQQQGLFSKLISSYLWTRKRDKLSNENARQVSCRFYSLCRRVCLCLSKKM